MTMERSNNLSASEALLRLKEGNKRYVSDTATHLRRGAERRSELVDTQSPFATIITCSDSRVLPELVFDQGLGDLFVIRVAGNIATDAVLGSIEYASLPLGVNLVVVMGHRNCGAVSAAVKHADFDGPATYSHIDALIDGIRPAVLASLEQGPDDLLDYSVRMNATMTAAQVRSSDPIMAGLQSRGVEVHPTYYDLASGEVLWLE